MLAQLLIQFQMPLEKTAVQNVTSIQLPNNYTFNDDTNNYTNNYTNNSTDELEPIKRSIRNVAENDPNELIHENSIPKASDFPTTGEGITAFDYNLMEN